ncbi:acyl-CoA dehydratase activase [Oceanispirochaeta sp.]|jgi:predicted CoA-substrate-specific enzyme activase|uniref:acyl-CoA dehydratase activase n=1 Tax=Oceanispirochaeta sp. TaxID=2035350 RepID=UPI00261A769D|nr:acyl-CoA dehydratase activase [Oceanispirochaeta sp.]MDA3958216.1 acyl-CoA dehydratase activase [Oceanispirochaeta sp.]
MTNKENQSDPAAADSRNQIYPIGLDVGSTTVKSVLLSPDQKTVLYQRYERHNARQRETALSILKDVSCQFPGIRISPVLCGSGSRELAEELGTSYLQEVVANSLAVRELYPQTRVAVELGGQDAKITFFYKDEHSGKLMASDMRMNGSCAGGTGAFLDETASILKLQVEDLNRSAEAGKTLYDISGRCGVFAKTDIQPLLNQGVRKEDLALSCFHAVAKQTIGGLAQGLEIHPPVLFEGGPLHFNPELINVFARRLDLKEEDVIIPENPEIMIARGAAISALTTFENGPVFDLDTFILNEAFAHADRGEAGSGIQPYFQNAEEQQTFQTRHALPEMADLKEHEGEILNVYMGIDAGSTTSKFVLIDESDSPIYRFYSKNEGEPIKILQEGLLDLKKQCDDLNIELNILGVGTTGYGEMLFAKAFQADYHIVETVAHAEAALRCEADASFILDIGGQDMKAIFLNDGIVTGITLNEACSAGCGSFLENFSENLKIPVEHIAERAFSSRAPSHLGSRCTVFMNSSVITEQKNGKTPDDIIAGLCYSVIENVFTKVIRLSNMKALGSRIIVQGGTFRNDAVLRALELFTEAEVTRAPWPGEMGAIGIARLTRKHMEEEGNPPSNFLKWSDLENFSYTRKSGLICPFCTNSCSRTVIEFAGGNTFITGNRCEKGEVLGDLKDPDVKIRLKKIKSENKDRRDVFRYREEILFRPYDGPSYSPAKDITIGIPRVLDFWENYPFWNALFTSLGFRIKLSSVSTVPLYESGLASIPSDTACFPSKLAHGHMQNLIAARVDRIFLPSMSRMISENKNIHSEHSCAVLKGYPMVLNISDEPLEKHNIPMDIPVFHWTDEKAQRDSITEFLTLTFALPEKQIRQAIDKALDFQEDYRQDLLTAGKNLLDSLGEGEFAIVMAGRPYHSDPLINHGLSDYFTREGLAVLPLDALPGLNEVDLSSVRAELTTNYHVRMMSAARMVAQDSRLEYVQIVSFGCGHDAILTDEIIRLLGREADKSPLVLKMDESEVTGPLNIRVKSFLETLQRKRNKGLIQPRETGKAYDVIFDKKARDKVILVPNVSWAFTQVATASIRLQGYKVEAMPMAGKLAISQGKKYVHNDMCFPAQINIGEFLAVLKEGTYHPDNVALALAKAQCDCRLAHYATMARQALDDAGYPQIPIITTDKDTKNMHPGFTMNAFFELRMLWGLIMTDILEGLRRKIRPYEKVPGSTNALFEESVMNICNGFSKGMKTVKNAFLEALKAFEVIPYDRSRRKPRVFMIGEFLLNFHPGSNNHIEDYLEKNGMEVIMPNLFNNMHREYLLEQDQRRQYHVSFSFLQNLMTDISEKYIRTVLKFCDKAVSGHPLWEETVPLRVIADRSQHIVDRTFTSGEGWMIPGEILHHADHGVHSFLILQPFGCLPNHVTGRGLVKKIKKEHPHIQVLALDYDPDTSFGNVENRLQMLIINARERDKEQYEENLQQKQEELQPS